MPRTVAALYLPLVRNLPLPSPHSLRVLGFFGAARAALDGHGASCSVSVRVVIPLAWVMLEDAVENSAVSGAAPAFGIEVSSTTPLRASTVEPTGMPWAASSATKRELPGSWTSTVPLCSLTTTVRFTTGVRVGVGVAVGVRRRGRDRRLRGSGRRRGGRGGRLDNGRDELVRAGVAQRPVGRSAPR